MDPGKQKALLEWVNCLSLGECIESLRQLRTGQHFWNIIKLIDKDQKVEDMECSVLILEKAKETLESLYSRSLDGIIDLKAIEKMGDEMEIAKVCLLLLCAGMLSANNTLFVNPAMELDMNIQQDIREMAEHVLPADNKRFDDSFHHILKQRLTATMPQMSSTPMVSQCTPPNSARGGGGGQTPTMFSTSLQAGNTILGKFYSPQTMPSSPMSPVQQLLKSPSVTNKILLNKKDLQIKKLQKQLTEERYMQSELETDIKLHEQEAQKKDVLISDLHAQLGQTRRESHSLQSQVDALLCTDQEKDAHSNTLKRNQKLLNEGREIRERNKFLESETDNLFKQIHDLKQQLGSVDLLRAECERYRRMVEEGDQQMGGHRQQLQEGREQLQQLQQTNYQLESEIEQLREMHRERLEDVRRKFDLSGTGPVSMALNLPNNSMSGECLNEVTDKILMEAEDNLQGVLAEKADLEAHCQNQAFELQTVQKTLAEHTALFENQLHKETSRNCELQATLHTNQERAADLERELKAVREKSQAEAAALETKVAGAEQTSCTLRDQLQTVSHQAQQLDLHKQEMEATMQKLELARQQLQHQLESLQREASERVMAMEQQLTTEREHKSSLQQQTEVLQTKLGHLQTELHTTQESSKQTVCELRSGIAKAEDKVCKQEKSLEEYKMKYAVLAEKQEMYSQKVESLAETSKVSKQQKEAAEGELTQQQTVRRRLEEDLAMCQVERDQLNQSLKDVQNKCQKAETEHRLAEETIRAMEDTVRQREGETSELQMTLSSAQVQLMHTEELSQTQLNAAQTRSNDLEIQLLQAEESLKEFREQLQTLQTSMQKNALNLEASRQKGLSLEEKLTQSRSEVAMWEEQAEVAQNRVVKLEGDVHDQQEQAQELTAQLRSELLVVQRQEQLLEEENCALRDNVTDGNQQLVECEEARVLFQQQCEGLTEELTVLRKTLEAAQQQQEVTVLEASGTQQQLEAHVEELTGAVAAEKDQAVALKMRLDEEVAQLEKGVQEQTSQSAALQKQLQENEALVGELSAEVQRLGVESQGHKQLCDSLSTQVTEKDASLVAMESNLKLEREQRETRAEEISSLRQECAALESRQDDTQCGLLVLRAEIETLNKAALTSAESWQNKVAELEQIVKQEAKQHAETKAELTRNLSETTERARLAEDRCEAVTRALENVKSSSSLEQCELRDALVRLEEDRARLEVVVSTTNSRLQATKQQWEESAACLCRTEMSLQERDSELQEMTERLREADSNLTNSSATGRELTQQVAALQSKLSSAESATQSLEVESQSRQQELEEVQTQVRAADAERKELRLQLEAGEVEVRACKQQFEEEERQEKAMHQQWQETVLQLATTNDTVQQLEGAVQESLQQLAEKEQALEASAELVKQVEGSMHKMAAEISQLKALVEDRERTLADKEQRVLVTEERLQVTVSQLQQQMEEGERGQQYTQELIATREQVTAQYSAAEQRANQLAGELDNKTVELTEALRKTEEVETKQQETVASCDRTRKVLQEQQEEVQQQLKHNLEEKTQVQTLLELQVQELQSQIVLKNEDLRQVTRQLQDTETKLVNSAHQLQSREVQVESLLKQVGEKESSLGSAMTRLNETEYGLRAAEEDRAARATEHVELTEHVAQLEREADSAGAVISQLSQQVQEARNRIGQVECDLEETRTVAGVKQGELTEQVAGLGRQIATQCEEVEQRQILIEQFQEQVETLRNEVAIKSGEISKQHIVVQQFQEQVNTLSSQVAIKNEEMLQQQILHQQHEEEVKTIGSEVVIANEAVSKQQSLIQQFEEKVNALLSQVAIKDEEMLQQQLLHQQFGEEFNEKMSKQQSVSQQFNERIETLSSQLITKTDEWSRLEILSRQFQEKLETLGSQLVIKTDEVAQQQSLIQQLQQKLHNAEQRVEALAEDHTEALQRNDLLQEQLQEKQHEVESATLLKSEVDDARRSRKQLHAQHLEDQLSLQKQLAQMQEQLQKVAAERNTAQQKVATLESRQLQDSRIYEEQLDGLETNYNERLGSAETKGAELQTRMTAANLEKQQLDARLTQLEKHLAQSEQRRKQSDSEVKLLLERDQQDQMSHARDMQHAEAQVQQLQIQLAERDQERRKESEKAKLEVERARKKTEKTKETCVEHITSLEQRYQENLEKETTRWQQKAESIEISYRKAKSGLSECERERKHYKEVADKYQGCYDSSQDKVAALNHECAEVKEQARQYESRCHELNNELSALNHKIREHEMNTKRQAAQIRSLETQLDHATRQLKTKERSVERAASSCGQVMGPPAPWSLQSDKMTTRSSDSRIVPGLSSNSLVSRSSQSLTSSHTETTFSAEPDEEEEDDGFRPLDLAQLAPPKEEDSQRPRAVGEDRTEHMDVEPNAPGNKHAHNMSSFSLASSTSSVFAEQTSPRSGAMTRSRASLSASDLPNFGRRTTMAGFAPTRSMQVPRGMGALLCAEDEPDMLEWGRLNELQRRNTLCRPHLRSAYPVEMQTVNVEDIEDDRLREGTPSNTLAENTPMRVTRKRKTPSHSGKDSEMEIGSATKRQLTPKNLDVLDMNTPGVKLYKRYSPRLHPDLTDSSAKELSRHRSGSLTSSNLDLPTFSLETPSATESATLPRSRAGRQHGTPKGSTPNKTWSRKNRKNKITPQKKRPDAENAEAKGKSKKDIVFSIANTPKKNRLPRFLGGKKTTDQSQPTKKPLGSNNEGATKKTGFWNR